MWSLSKIAVVTSFLTLAPTVFQRDSTNCSAQLYNALCYNDDTKAKNIVVKNPLDTIIDDILKDSDSIVINNDTIVIDKNNNEMNQILNDWEFILDWKKYVVKWKEQTVNASYYWWKFHWRKTASWEVFNQWAHTAASRTLPFWTKVLLVDTTSWDSIVVRINDRWPYVKWRQLDVSKWVASELWNMLLAWHKNIKMTIVEEVQNKNDWINKLNNVNLADSTTKDEIDTNQIDTKNS